MSSKYLIRESYQGRIVPRNDFGLYPSRKSAKQAAKRLGLPGDLILAVRRQR